MLKHSKHITNRIMQINKKELLAVWT